jgi:hypothetical protein
MGTLIIYWTKVRFKHGALREESSLAKYKKQDP